VNRSVCTKLLVAVLLMSIVEPSAAQSDGSFQLSVTREYRRALFGYCRLAMTIAAGKGRSSLICSRASDSGHSFPDISRGRALTTKEVAEILRLSRASDFFGDSYRGADLKPTEALFETLAVTEESGRTVELVASNNPTFESGSRRDLIVLLRAHLNELQKAAINE
jgi:hypothetical protein